MESNPSASAFDIRAITDSPLVRRLLGGNSSPSDDERSTLTTCRKKGRGHLASLNESIEVMKAQLAIMTEDVSQLSKELKALDIVLHPVRILPHEIIQHICQLAMEDLQSPSFEALASRNIIDSLSMRHPSWVCAHVCQRWRYIICNAPQCWTGVVLLFDKPVVSLKLSLLLGHMMSRTRDLPLSITLHSRRPIPLLAMPAILQSCSRWRHATLSLTMTDYKLFSEMKHAFGVLRTLQLDLAEPAPLSTLARAIDAFSEAPCLYSLETVNDITSFFNLGWHRIQRFTQQGGLSALPIAVALGILVRMRSNGIADLTLARFPMIMFAPTSITTVLPSLCTLTLRDGPYGATTRVSCIAFFLRTVLLPNLTSLTLDMVSLSSLSDLQGGGGPSIFKLSLSVQIFEPQDSEALGKFLEYAPSTQHFTLDVEREVDLDFVFSRAQDAFMQLPIHSLIFTAEGSVTMSQTDGLSRAGDSFSALWEKGVFKTLSIRGASRVGDQARRPC